jgi:predicted kinase
MNHTAVLIGGLPGSGKTQYAKLIYSDYLLIDDPNDIEKDVIPYLGRDLVITSPFFCSKETKEKAVSFFKGKDYVVEYISLDTPIEVCWERIQKRNVGDGRGITYKDLLFFQRLTLIK